jgi:hypothetical protein
MNERAPSSNIASDLRPCSTPLVPSVSAVELGVEPCDHERLEGHLVDSGADAGAFEERVREADGGLHRRLVRTGS